MRDLVKLIVWMVADSFRSRTALEVEIRMLRQRINVLRRTAPKKQTFSAIDRLIFVCLFRLLPGVRDALAIVKPETVVKWHRAGFRLYWRWKSKRGVAPRDDVLGDEHDRLQFSGIGRSLHRGARPRTRQGHRESRL